MALKNIVKKKVIKINPPIIRRIAAFIIDLLILEFFIVSPFASFISKIAPANESITQMTQSLYNDHKAAELLTAVILMIGVFAFAYFTLLEYLLGQTIGEILLNITVESTNGELSLFQAMLSNLFILPIFPFILLWVIDPLLLVFTKYQQTLSQFISKTASVMRYEV